MSVSTKVFGIAISLAIAFLQCGCINFTLKGVPKGEDSFMVQNLSMRWSEYLQPVYGVCGQDGTMKYQRKLNMYLEAESLRCIDGIPLEDDEVNFAVGLIPGYYGKIGPGEKDPVSFLIASTLTSAVALGIPVVGALLFEPFMSPAYPSRSPRISWYSPIGFCKYKKIKRQVQRLGNYRYEFRGRIYDVDKNGFCSNDFPGISKGDVVKIKLLSAPSAVTTCFNDGSIETFDLRGLQDFVGMELESVVP